MEPDFWERKNQYKKSMLNIFRSRNIRRQSWFLDDIIQTFQECKNFESIHNLSGTETRDRFINGPNISSSKYLSPPPPHTFFFKICPPLPKKHGLPINELLSEKGGTGDWLKTNWLWKNNYIIRINFRAIWLCEIFKSSCGFHLTHPGKWNISRVPWFVFYSETHKLTLKKKVFRDNDF